MAHHVWLWYAGKIPCRIPILHRPCALAGSWSFQRKHTGGDNEGDNAKTVIFIAEPRQVKNPFALTFCGMQNLYHLTSFPVWSKNLVRSTPVNISPSRMPHQTHIYFCGHPRRGRRAFELFHNGDVTCCQSFYELKRVWLLLTVPNVASSRKNVPL